MKRGVIYARYSCEKQTENSTKAQIRECEAWAKTNGIHVIDIYKDEAISGRTDNRPGFQKMIGDARKHLFDFIIVWKGDRFSRSRADAARYKAMLSKLGIHILSVTEANLEGPEAILVDGINESYAEFYSADLSRKVLRGMRQNIIDGKFNGGPVAFGYILNKETRHMEIDPDKSEVVKAMFRQYVYEDMNPSQIKKYWEARGYHIPGKSGVINILMNEKYIGIWRYEELVNRTCYPPIVDEELFRQAKEKAQEKLHKGSRYKKPRDPFLLLGKAYCGCCNSLLIACSGTSRNGTQHRYYKCPGQKEGKCSMHGVPKQALEDLVVKTVMNLICDQVEVDRIIKTILSKQKDLNPALDDLAVKIGSKKTQIGNLTTAISYGGNIPELIAMMNQCKEEVMELETAYLREQRKSKALTEEQLRSFFESLKDIDITDRQKRIFLISAFVNSVIIHDEGDVEILTNYRGNDGVFLKSTAVRLLSSEVHQNENKAASDRGFLVFLLFRLN